MRKAKKNSWKSLCEEVESTKATSRLHKMLSKEHQSTIGSMKKPDGSYTNSIKETMEFMTDVHFPGRTISWTEHENGETLGSYDDHEHSSLITEENVKWAIKSFKSFKSPGVDGIFPALLQRACDLIMNPLIVMFQCSLRLGYIPFGWCKARVTFIPKAGKRPSDLPESFRPIALTSFILKIMEKILDRTVRDVYLAKEPFHPRQFAYQEGKSTTTAVKSLVIDIERVLKYKQSAIGISFDIQGAFDNVSHEVIRKALEKKKVPKVLINWICIMLSKRALNAL